MRLELTFESSTNIISADYRRIFVSFLKNAIGSAKQAQYYERYFSTLAKDYSFTVIFENPKFQGDEIHLGGRNIKMIFSAADSNNTGFIFGHAFIAQENKEFPLPRGHSMILKSMKKVKEEQIVNSKVIFKTIVGTGLVIREHFRDTNKDKYYVWGEKQAEVQFQRVLIEQLSRAGFALAQAENIQVKPIQSKKVVVKHYERYIDVNVGMFEMQADTSVLQYLYQAGAGSRHSIGFGMLELVTQDLL
jgi:CRISPR-associated endoribonuclease Cas6